MKYNIRFNLWLNFGSMCLEFGLVWLSQVSFIYTAQ